MLRKHTLCAVYHIHRVHRAGSTGITSINVKDVVCGTSELSHADKSKELAGSGWCPDHPIQHTGEVDWCIAAVSSAVMHAVGSWAEAKWAAAMRLF